jgi:hypothetical protein
MTEAARALKRAHRKLEADARPSLKEFAKLVSNTSDLGPLAQEWLKRKANPPNLPRTRKTPPPGGGTCQKKKGNGKPKTKRFAPRRSRKRSNWYAQ